ncbi:glycosyltransferase [Leeuwenhoekiella sp. MAR_2009_132]|uniref:glycosyltransferase n=1 Tax=Leeuwenhoekiella sp. MAR_2009_132 TaxID=1392489 RepID=UPI00048F1E1C|nr:glycosyltransferase [Leeuwenhoekiella sp. MAR_2009_132]
MKSDFFKNITLVITTYNRKVALCETLNKLKGIIPFKQIIICNDASTDLSYYGLYKHFSEIRWITNTSNEGLISSRNRLMNLVKTEYIISLDDDAHFLTPEALLNAINFMEENDDCGVLAFRLFWGLNKPKTTISRFKVKRVRNYVGCGHLYRTEVWKNVVVQYPDWYQFYGEEDYASLKLFKAGWHIYYFPQVLIHHRVSLKKRKRQKESQSRTRRSLHAAWSNYLIFYPRTIAYQRILYSLKEQIRLKLLKGDLKLIKYLSLAILDLIQFTPKRQRLNFRLDNDQLRNYLNLPQAPIYWKPKKVKSIDR